MQCVAYDRENVFAQLMEAVKYNSEEKLGSECSFLGPLNLAKLGESVL